MLVQDRVITRVLGRRGPLRLPFGIRLLGRLPIRQRIPGWLVGVGIRPEHVRTPILAPTGGADESRIRR